MPRFSAKPRQLAGFSVLTALAVAGNHFSIPLFFGVNFVFGSIAVLIILRCFGLAAGLTAAVLGSIPTLFLWSHPFALIVFVAEALAVGILLQRKKTDLILADGLFWLFAGIPLVWLFYFGIMRLDASTILFVSLKQSANGILNALIASILLNYLPVRRWLGLPETAEPQPLADILFRLILVLVLLPTFVLMVINGRASIRSLELRLQQELNAAASDISYHLYTRLQLHQHAVATLAEIAANFEIAPSRSLQRITALVSRSFPSFHNMYIANEDGITVAFYPPVNARGISTIGLDFSDRTYFRRLKTTGKPVISDLFLARGGVEEPTIALTFPILKNGDFSGYALGALDLKGILMLLRSYAETKQMEIILLDEQRRVMASTEETLPLMTHYDLREGETKALTEDLFRIIPAEGGQPAIKRWLQSSVVRESRVAPDLPWILLVKSPLAAQEEILTAIYIRHLALMLVLVVLAILIAGAVGRSFTRSIKQLGAVTSDLPVRLLTGGNIARLPWPQAKTEEMRTVIENFKAMAASLQQNFGELQARSRELAGLNDELQEEMAERHRLEETVQRQKRMETIGNLAASVAHDLNNILSGLVGYPDLLLHELPADSPLRGRILRIKDSGERAAAVVQDLLTMARRGVIQKKIINFNQIVESYLESPDANSLQARHPDIAIRSLLAPDLLNVSGSEVHIAKSLMNLVMNAAEAMPAGGEIVIATANRSLDTPVAAFERIDPGDYAVLEVSDNGIGIAPQDRQKIFEPFYTKKVMGRSGTGLGMSVVWTTVKDHGGFIDLQGEEGRGTTVAIYLPVTRVEPAATGRIPLEHYLGNETVLVVDDLEDQREIAAGMLSKLGYRVLTAVDGEEAIRSVREQPVDLLVLDMIMEPGPDGLETYRRILEMRPGQKAIIASGFAENERVREALQLGAGAYVGKPYTLEKLGVAVRKELDRR